MRKCWDCLSSSFVHHWYSAYILPRKVEMGKVRWSSAFGFGQGFKLHSVFSRAHLTPFAPSTRRSPPWNHDILNFLSQTWSWDGQRLPGDNFCLQPKCSLPWTRIPSRQETKVLIYQLSVDVIWILVNQSQIFRQQGHVTPVQSGLCLQHRRLQRHSLRCCGQALYRPCTSGERSLA